MIKTMTASCEMPSPELCKPVPGLNGPPSDDKPSPVPAVMFAGSVSDGGGTIGGGIGMDDGSSSGTVPPSVGRISPSGLT